MTEQIRPNGPFYVELVYEDDAPDSGDYVGSAYIGGFESEADAWAACQNISASPIRALNAAGEDVTIAPHRLVQMLIARRSQDVAALTRPF